MRVAVGVCGGIAAYKAAEVVRSLQEHGAEVEVIMTSSAERFITPLTFNALTGKPVHTSLWSPDQAQLADGPIEHIAIAQWADVLLVLPATANTLARFAHGLADDFLTTVYLATKAPVAIAPAMNVNMWEHPATRDNLALLQKRGVAIVEPESGYLACGMTGGGRLAATATIVAAALSAATHHRLTGRNSVPDQDLAGETVLITAGGTREAIDPVRFLGNRSSGRMGHALADAAHARGAETILITASALPAPDGTDVLRVESAAEMEAALLSALPRASIVIAAAAVADFRPITPSATKLRRNGPLHLELEPTPDLVAEAVRRRRPGTLVIAFAAETEHLEENARAKLLRKGVDAIVGNNVADASIGFDATENAGLFLTKRTMAVLPREPKRAMADRILSHALKLRNRKVSGSAATGSSVLNLSS